MSNRSTMGASALCSLSVLIICLCWGSSPATAQREAIASRSTVHGELHSIVEQQANAWNAGNIDEFMIPYWHSDRLTFSSGGQIERGWQATLDRYRAKYPDKATMGELVFSNLESQDLGPDAVLMLGEWHLKRDNPVGGNFSLVWKKVDGRWVIVHDHTSVKPDATSK